MKEIRTLIIGRKAIVTNIFQNKNQVKDWDKIEINDFVKNKMMAYTFGNWMKNETKQIRWNLISKIAKQYKLKIIWLRSPFANGLHNKYIFIKLLELVKLGVVHNPNIKQLYGINSKLYYTKIPKQLILPNTLSFHLTTKNDINILISKLSKIRKFYENKNIKSVRIKKGFSAHGKNQIILNVKLLNKTNIYEFLKPTIGKGNTFIFQPNVKQYIRKNVNIFTKYDMKRYGYKLNEYRFFILNGRIYPKLVTGRYPQQKWIAYDILQEENETKRNELKSCMNKVKECLKWYKIYYKSVPILLRIDIIHDKKKAYMSEFETESGVGPITSIGLLKKDEHLQCDFFEKLKDEINKFHKKEIKHETNIKSSDKILYNMIK